MFRRAKKALVLGWKAAGGAVLGAIGVPLLSVLRSKGELHVQMEPTCNGVFIGIDIGPPCHHEDDEGGGPEAHNPDVEAQRSPWSQPQAEA